MNGWTEILTSAVPQDPISKYRQASNEPLPPGFDQAAWRNKHFTFATENVPKWAEAVKAKYASEKTRIACVGYCFGAPFVCTLLAGDLVSAGAFAHPSLLKEEHFRNLKSKLYASAVAQSQFALHLTRVRMYKSSGLLYD